MNDKPTISAILTIYRRQNWNEQLRAILKQSHLPVEILVYQNGSYVHFEVDPELRARLDELSIPLRHLHSKDFNFKFHGRFTVPLLLSTEYVAIFDDDTIPGELWLKNCIDTSKKYTCAVGANGRIISDLDNLRHMDGAGGYDASDTATEVDFIGHCWFFRREWIHHMWKHAPNTFENGEDMHFSASLQLAGIPSYCPPQPANDLRYWGDLVPQLGTDDHATFKRADHHPIRASVTRYWMSKGWNLVRFRDD